VTAPPLEAYRASISIQSFLEREVLGQVEAWEKSATVPREVFARLGARGLIAACIPPTSDDRAAVSLDLQRFAVLVEEVARARCFGLLLGIAIHVGVVLPFLSRLGSPRLKEQWLPRALSGESLGAIAATEPGVAGSDLLGIQAAVERTGDGLILSGEKSYVTNIPGADLMVVLARWRAGRHFSNLVALAVPANAPGVRCERTPLAVMRTAAVGRVGFDKVALAPDAVLGRKELGMAYFQEHIAVERLTGGIWAAAAAEDLLAQAQQRCASRRVGEETLWDRGAVRQRLAAAVVQTSMLRALVDQAVARSGARGRVDLLDAAIIKAATAPVVESTAGLCLQLQGAEGFLEGSPLLRLVNDFRVFGVAGGTTETMLEVVADLWSGQVPRAADAPTPSGP
jgi:alkylation response protein AidB-like acyl-CoA dehydrogenase